MTIVGIDSMYNGAENNDSTETALMDSIGNVELRELALDVGKLTIDTVLQDDLVTSVPIIGTMVNIYKTSISVRDRLFLMKVLMFLDELAAIPTGNRQRFSDELARDAGARAKAGANLALLLDRLDDLEKPKLVGRVYLSRLKDEISFNDLRRFCMVIDRAFLPDLRALSMLRSAERVDATSAPFLNALGLVTVTGENYDTVDGIGAETWYEINDFGKRFLSVVFPQ